MKRLQLIITVAAITAGLIWWSFYRSRHTSSAAVTSLLPKETLALVQLPDLNRSHAELRQTDLYQIWSEPAVQDFLQKPRSKISANLGFGSIIRECEALQMKDLFIAVIGIENSAWKIVGGFRFKGDPGNAENTVANWKAKLLGKAADLKQEVLEYQGHRIQTDSAGIVRLSVVRNGEWFFLADDPELLKPILDRVDGRVTDANSVLAADEVFAAASKHMPSIYNILGFARVDQLVEKFIPRSEEGQGESTDQATVIRQIHSLCGTTSFDGGKIRDSIFVGMPKLLDAGSLTRTSLPIATKETFLYATSFLNLTKPIPLLGSQAALGWLDGMQKIFAALSSSGITLETWNSAFGPEFSWVGNWAANSHWPLLFATIPVKDPTKAKKILETITAASGDSEDWTQKEKGGVHYFSTRTGGRLFSLSPTIGLSDRILVAGAGEAAIETAMKRIASGDSELAASKTFRLAERSVPAAEQMFTYIDPALIYSRVDATLRPMLFWGAAFLPGMADSVDLSKWPASEAITRHLSPIVMSQRYDGDGYISESVGPVTVYQAIIGVGGLGGAAGLYYQTQTRRSASSLIPAVPVQVASPSVSRSPSPSPDDSPE